MHGFGWFLHEAHHQAKYNGFEKNDPFFVIFATPSMLLFYFGSFTEYTYLPIIGLGMLWSGLLFIA